MDTIKQNEIEPNKEDERLTLTPIFHEFGCNPASLFKISTLITTFRAINC